MAIYEVHVREDLSGAAKLQSARFLRDRVSIIALVLPAIWLLFNRLWWELIAYVLLMAFMSGFAATDYILIGAVLSLLPGFYVFLEGSNLIADKWRSEGYGLIDLVEADGRENAELRWFSCQNRMAMASALVEPVAAPSNPPIQPNKFTKEDQAEFGLFAEG